MSAGDAPFDRKQWVWRACKLAVRLGHSPVTMSSRHQTKVNDIKTTVEEVIRQYKSTERGQYSSYEGRLSATQYRSFS